MANPTYSPQGLVARLIANAIRTASDGNPSASAGPRFDPYQGQIVYPYGAGNYGFVDEGSYQQFATTIGTGIAFGATTTAYSATAPFLIVQNNEPVTAQGRNLYLDYIRLGCTAAPTASTALFAATQVDYISRYSSGATLIVNATGATGGQVSNPNSAVGSASTVSVWGGPLTAAAVGSAVRNLAPAIPLKGSIPAVGDNYTISFGSSDTPPSALGARHAGVVLAPGASFLLYLWAPAQTASGTFSVDIGAWLR